MNIMNRKNLFFTALSVLIIVAGLHIIPNQNWSQFSGEKKLRPASAEITIGNATVFNEENERLLQQLINDSVRIMFRFTPNTCSCLEPEFSTAVRHAVKNTDTNRVFVVISETTPKDLRFFRDRTKLPCPIFSTAEILHDVYDATQNPYACIVFPDMTVRNVVTINPKNINDLISDVKKIIN